MCPCHDQLVMQSLPTMISRRYLLYFNFYKSMFCYFKTLQLKACLDRKMWQILPPPFKSMRSQVLNCTYHVTDFDDNHSCSQNIWSEKCQVRSQSVLWFEGDDNVVLWICTDLISQHSVQSPHVVCSGSF